MILCPSCKNKFKYKALYRVTKGIRKVECCYCKKTLNQTYKSRMVNSLILTIPIFSFTVFSETINKILSAFTSNYIIELIIVGIIGGVWGAVVFAIDFP